jgi:hypothetical protein
MEFQYFLIVSGEGSSAVKTRDCGGSRALKTEMSIFSPEFQYFLIVRGQG